MTHSSGRRQPNPVPLIAGLAALALGATAAVARASDAPAQVPPSIGDRVRLFPVPDLDGRNVDVGSLLQGKVALIAMWASWCQPCISEIPGLRDLATRYRDRGLVVLGV